MSYGPMAIKFGRRRREGTRSGSSSSAATPPESVAVSIEPGASTAATPVKKLAGMPEWAIQRWSEQMHEGQAAGNPVGPAKRRPNKLTKAPESWAKWSAHGREERTASAGSRNNVTSKDFAVTSTEDRVVEWSTDKTPKTPTTGIRSFSGKFGKVVKTGMTKLKKTKSGFNDDMRGNSLRGRRSSSQEGGNLDYPELEVMRTEAGYYDLMALERETDTMRGTGRPSLVVGPNSARKISLSARPPAMLYDAEHADVTCDGGSTPRGPRPETPANLPTQHLRDSTTTTIERYMTPVSRMSQSDATTPKAGGVSEFAETDVPAVMRRSKSEAGRHKRRDNKKYATWGGRARTQPILMKSTADFHIGLEKRLNEERARAIRAGRQSPGGSIDGDA